MMAPGSLLYTMNALMCREAGGCVPARSPGRHILRAGSVLSSLKMGFLGRCLGLAFSSPILTHTSLSPQNPPPPPPRHLGGASKTPREFLAELPPGPYTCLRGRGLALLGFDFHYQRFQEGLRAAGAEVDKGLKSQVLDGIETAIMAVLRKASQAYDVTDEFDTFVTLHGEQQGKQVKLNVHAFPMPFVNIPEPVTLEVRGDGRVRPEIKHTQWLRDREPLERYRVGSGGEVVLSRKREDGERELLEGLVTNLVVVQGGALYTAREGVLRGHIQHMLLEAARDFGVEVVEQAPLVGDMDRWEEVFITGSGRLIVPVSTIQGSTYNIAPVSFNAPGPLTNKLRHRLLYDIAKAWTPIDTLRGRQPHNPQ